MKFLNSGGGVNNASKKKPRPEETIKNKRQKLIQPEEVDINEEGVQKRTSTDSDCSVDTVFNSNESSFQELYDELNCQMFQQHNFSRALVSSPMDEELEMVSLFDEDETNPSQNQTNQNPNYNKNQKKTKNSKTIVTRKQPLELSHINTKQPLTRVQMISRIKFFVFDCLTHDMKILPKNKTSFCNFTQNNLYCHHPKIFKCSECGELMKYKKATKHPDFAILNEIIDITNISNQVDIVVRFIRIPETPIEKWITELLINDQKVEVISLKKEIFKSKIDSDLKTVLMMLNSSLKIQLKINLLFMETNSS
eukprot:gene5340-9149_t